MPVTFTANKGYTLVTVGTESGTWGPYVNGNESLLDSNMGGLATIALTNSPVTLSSGQYSCAFIRLTGAISADVALTFPSVGSFYTIINDTTNSSNFVVTMGTSAGGRTIGLPPGSMTDVMTDGSNSRFKNMPYVGAYWDHAGSSTPRWVSACTIAPWLYCDGSGFSGVTYPTLASLLGGTTLPDLRGRVRAYFNDGTGRITSAGGGVDGNTVLASGGLQSGILAQANLPNYNLTVTDPGHAHGLHSQQNTFVGGAGLAVPLAGSFGANNAQGNTDTATTGITVNSGGSGVGVPLLPPITIGGITLIRAA